MVRETDFRHSRFHTALVELAKLNSFLVVKTASTYDVKGCYSYAEGNPP
jgi:hypothetical protein